MTAVELQLGGEVEAVQEPLVRYAAEIGWRELSRDGALTLRRGEGGTLLYPALRDKLVELNPGILDLEAAEQVVMRIEGARPSIEGNVEVLAWMRGERGWYVEAERRTRNVTVIDFENPANNLFHVTSEWQYTNGLKTNRADVMFLINGLPVALVETKGVRRRDGIERGLKQVRRYHEETPELVTAAQIFDVTHLVRFLYGVTWNLERKSLFDWKDEESGNFERKVKRFFARERFLRLLREWILVVRQDDELRKVVLRQHQMRAVDRTVERALDPAKRRGLIWHTQGSGKTFSMIAATERILQDPAFGKPTVLMIVDRNELESQLFANLRAYGLEAREARSKRELREILASDYRGLVVSMIHKFDGADARLCERDNVYVLVDEAHRSTGGDLGNYLLAALPNATVIGFTGTPIDRTAHGQGTFKVFGRDDPQGYLDKYTIRESIEDGTTLRLHYTLAPNEIRVPREQLEEEFLALTEAEGVTDIEELDRILKRAVRLNAFLKAPDRVERVADFVVRHFRDAVEPLGYKAFLVGVDREACALYKEALDRRLPPAVSAVVYTAAQNDEEALRRYHISAEEEKRIRRAFVKARQDPRILIVTEKLLTGFDAPILYCMYLDKPMRDHALLQAIARVNRPYEDIAGKEKTAGVVVDFVGIFERLERALAFDSDVVSGVIEDLSVLHDRFAELMAGPGAEYLRIPGTETGDKAVERVLDALADPEPRQRFLDFYQELRNLYEVLSPDPSLRPHIDAYRSLTELYDVVRSAYYPTDLADRELTGKTAALIGEATSSYGLAATLPVVEIDEETLDTLARSASSSRTKVLNLGRSLIRTVAERAPEQPFLIPIGDRVQRVLESYGERQIETEEALRVLERLVEEINVAAREREELGLEPKAFAVYRLLRRTGQDDPRELAEAVSATIERFPHFADNAAQLRSLKADLYRLLMPVMDRKSMVDAVEQILRQVR